MPISFKQTKPIARAGQFRRRLLRWYYAHRRDLPWRREKAAYRIWVSEIMLQQTRVAAVLGYYARFLSRFPHVRALAAASEQDALAAWSGLGYYRRARMMHAAAKEVVLRGGSFPPTAAGLRELPGIGRYTAAAIASMAYGEAAAVVDGNVERVLRRIRGNNEGEPLDCWSEAEALLDRERPGDFNQAMMELGATVCLPKAPLCAECPVREWCGSRGEHKTTARAPRHKKKLRYLLAEKQGRVLLIQRAKSAGLMAGMWELPSGDGTKGNELFRVRHSITSTDYQVSVFAMEPLPRAASARWFNIATLHEMALTGVARKILRRAGIMEHH